MSETYYDRLGVPRDATTEDIERAYRECLIETHPDVSDAPDASEHTRDLIEAKEVLTDDRERARYDRLGHEAYLADRDGPQAAGADASATGPGDVGGVASSTGTGASAATADSHEPHGARRTGSASRASRTDSGAARAGNHTAGRHVHASRRRTDGAASTARAHGVDRSRTASRVFQSQESVFLVAAAFAVYPVVLWAALEPALPLPFNVVVAGSLLALVVFLVGLPEVGIAVFGTWSVLLPVVLTAGFGFDLFSLVVFVALGGTVVPLCLSVLTLVALRA